MTISQPSVAASAGVLGDVDRVVYSDLRTISNDATARITSHKVSSWLTFSGASDNSNRQASTTVE